MKLRNKKTGEIKEYTHTMTSYHVPIEGGYEIFTPWKPEEWEELEDVKEPLIKDEKIRRGIRAWWDMQDNPFKAASVYCDKEKDLDGLYHWRICGYIAEGEQKEATCLEFRTKKLYEFKYFKDYTKEELCGEEG